jgi:hypothetical protein
MTKERILTLLEKTGKDYYLGRTYVGNVWGREAKKKIEKSRHICSVPAFALVPSWLIGMFYFYCNL